MPATPIKINRASESEQKRATAKTWRPISPCLRTNEFCAPIASINDKPRIKPVKKAFSIYLISFYSILIIKTYKKSFKILVNVSSVPLIVLLDL